MKPGPSRPPSFVVPSAPQRDYLSSGDTSPDNDDDTKTLYINWNNDKKKSDGTGVGNHFSGNLIITRHTIGHVLSLQLLLNTTSGNQKLLY